MQGRRVSDDVTPDLLEPGDYCLRRSILWARTPNGTLCRIDSRWSITEEPDGSLTVGAAPGSTSSSIEVHGGGGVEYWHGHLIAGVWGP